MTGLPSMVSFAPRSNYPVQALGVVSKKAPTATTHFHRAPGAGRGRGGPLGFEALEAIASGLAESAPLIDHAWIPRGRLGYARLQRSDDYDAWVVLWPTSSTLGLHGHAGSHGVIVVSAGWLIETYTDRKTLHPARTGVLSNGDAARISATRVHALSNPGPEEALSVHVYSPPFHCTEASTR